MKRTFNDILEFIVVQFWEHVLGIFIGSITSLIVSLLLANLEQVYKSLNISTVDLPNYVIAIEKIFYGFEIASLISTIASGVFLIAKLFKAFMEWIIDEFRNLF